MISTHFALEIWCVIPITIGMPANWRGVTPRARKKAVSGFVVDVIEDPDEKQVDLFPKVLVYDTQRRKTILTHAYNIEFISRGS